MSWVLYCPLAIAVSVFASLDACATAPSSEGPTAVVESILRPCAGAAQVGIRASVAADAETACEGVVRALEFMANLGLESPPATTIEIVPALPGELTGRAVGCYLRSTKSILLLSYDAFVAGGQWFRMQADRELYRAVAAHEMAHAVVGCHSEPARLPVAAHEYVAYVVMFGTLDQQLRQRLLDKFPGSGFASTVQINDINHIVEPNQYGADSWRHYLRRKDKAAWLREVIEGRVVQEFSSEGP